MATEDYTAYRVYCEYFCPQIALPHVLGAASDGAAGPGRAEQVVDISIQRHCNRQQ
jgi:hypothetical protein